MSAPYGTEITEKCVICKLRDSGFFCDLPKGTLQELERIKYASAYPPGAVLFVEGQAPRGVYIICSGRVKLSTTSRDGKTLILRIRRPWRSAGPARHGVGETLRIDRRNTAAVPVGFCAARRFPAFPGTPRRCLAERGPAPEPELPERLRNDLVAGALALGLGKNARLLLEWVTDGEETKDGIRIKISLTHEEIAQLIGTSRETVTPVLSEFREKKTAQLRGSTLMILSKPGLERLVGA